MEAKFLFVVLDTVTITTLLLVLLFAVGVVWRVEKKMDIAYKCFVGAVICLAGSEIWALSASEDMLSFILGKVLRLLGAVLFLASILLMRSIVRVLDHEKPGNSE